MTRLYTDDPYVASLVAAAPPFSEETARLLTRILGPAHEVLDARDGSRSAGGTPPPAARVPQPTADT